MSEKHFRGKQPSLPRRANQIHRFAHDLATHRVGLVSLRSAASDKIGYAVAVLMGAAGYRWGPSLLESTGYRWGGWPIVWFLALGYAFNGYMSYRQYLKRAKRV
jgi:hypothetical protein